MAKGAAFAACVLAAALGLADELPDGFASPPASARPWVYWMILRIGHTPTGADNGFSTPEGRGLDCDKLSRGALEAHLAGMVDKPIADAGPLVGKSLTMLHDDSWESGAMNWTAAFPEEFKKRRGYDPTPWLPVMAGGRVVGSLERIRPCWSRDCSAR